MKEVLRRTLRTGLIVVAVALALAVAALWLVVQPFVTPVATQSPAVDPRRLQAHVKHLSVDLYPRSADQYDKLDRAAQYVEDELRKTGADVSVQPVTVDEVRYRNIVARFGPRTGPVTVFGAHYDSHGDAVEGQHAPSTDTHTPGADDNASGVAGLIELARLLAAKPPAQAVELVAYTLEEPPHFRTENMGSAWHARALAESGRECRLMVAVEMIGFFSDKPGSQAFPVPAMSRLYTDRGDFIALVGKFSDFALMRRAKALMAGAGSLPVHSISVTPLVTGIDFSDHLSYWNRGMPALMVTDTSFMRNPNYHLAGDTWDKLDYFRMAQVVQGLFAIAQGL
ncbi:M28 family peptidase [Piscinibacter terrae]|uniref:Peptidase M28 n=1 Tax=Piscinibacter terrae TaxID=2496871 RepID=A0A3N7HK70_9BURK|nr:M28 family peptidase [Albitalea terrae]RQP21933.1 peptidase M28 [Albitalea terrae]